ncbi:hypothetical protein CAC42_209 [Sphaceloma murrayae]|uniref:Uncharacterized protein n=1 Tax=Sphaceloma murrayae TaxID=2082308 RepID=A0A2K1QMW9_9PEZI|nr:hypothetical protein CAC42_209 [Sphaceloma murrayae]
MAKRTASQSGRDDAEINSDRSSKRPRTVEELTSLQSEPAPSATSPPRQDLVVKLKIPAHLHYDLAIILQADPRPAHGVSSSAFEAKQLAVAVNASREILLDPLTRAALATPGFSMITALCDHIDVLLRVVSFMPSRAIINLYSISAPFHYHFNSRYETFILAGTQLWAPNAEDIWPWKHYRTLCISDPALRLPSTYVSAHSIRDGAAAPTMTQPPTTSSPPAPFTSHHGSNDPLPVKPIPSLRYLSMCVYRHLVIKEIIALLISASHVVPATATALALQKVWFLLDIPVSAPRLGLIQNRAYFTDTDLWALHLFFVKLDMYWTDPVNYLGGEKMVREYLMQERTLSTLWDFLRGRRNASVDMLSLWVKHGYTPRERIYGPLTKEGQEAWENKAEYTIMDVPVAMCGRGGYELYGLGRARLIRPDELVMREQVRRQLRLEATMFKFIRYGYMDEHLRPVRKWELEELLPYRKEEKRLMLKRIREGMRKRQIERVKEMAREREEGDETRRALDAVTMEVD